MNPHIPSESLSAYVDEALNDTERLEIERHLSLCGQCKKEVDQLLRVKELLRPQMNYPVPPFFAARLTATLKARNERSALADFVWVAKRLMPGFAIFLAVIWLWSSSKTSEVSSVAEEYYASTDSTSAMALLAANERDLTTDDVLRLAVLEPSDLE
jgi:anti-sigma factor RsiW